MTKKKKRIRLLVSLLIVIVLCAVYVLVRQTDWESEEEETTELEILDIDPQEVSAVKIENEKGTILLSYNGEIWKSEDDPELELNQDSLDNLINRLHPLSVKRELPEVLEDLSAYGLESPEIRVAIALQDGTELTLSFGAEAADGTVYLMTSESGSVYTSDSALSSAFDCSLEDLKAVDEEETEEKEEEETGEEAEETEE